MTTRLASRKLTIGHAVTAALASALLTGCATPGMPQAGRSADTEDARAAAEAQQAIAQAEAAVQGNGRNAEYRAALGAAYLDAGRFASAATSFGDAMALGDHSPRTVLSLGLAMIGEGRLDAAADLLGRQGGDIQTSDLGLALALAGQPERGIHLMGNAIRGGDNTAKMRQNLAYSYALAGRWREARLMAAQDVPAGLIDQRIEQWSRTVHPQAARYRVAKLLGVPAQMPDMGQPVELALTPDAAVEQLAAQSLPEPAAAAIELPPLAAPVAQISPPSLPEPASVDRAREFQAAFGTPAPSGVPLARAVQQPMHFAAAPAAQPVAAPRPAATPAPVAATRATGTHLVQLGSFASEQSARRAWDIYLRQYPELADRRMVLSQAVVNGRHYWRVAASGFDRADSRALCGRVKARGEGCLAYARSTPLPGTVDRGVRLARR